MKKLLAVLAAAFVVTSSSAFAIAEDYDYTQARMVLGAGEIYIVSPFEDQDRFSLYTYTGSLIWEKKFGPKILSWDAHENYIYVFSKARSGNKTFLTCLDKLTGNIIWER